MNCTTCGKEIEKYIHKSKLERNKHFFCCRECYVKWWANNVAKGEKNFNWKGGNIYRNCLQCGSKFSTKRNNIAKGYGNFCSSVCYGKYNAHKHMGENNVNWKGGISSEYDKIKSTDEYKQWRMRIYNRDRFSCKLCGVRGNRKNAIDAHHIYKFSEYPELRFDINNGITLCRKCHTSILWKEEQYIALFKSLIESVEANYARLPMGEDRVRPTQECVESHRTKNDVTVNKQLA
jgi:hypothetical protein